MFRFLKTKTFWTLVILGIIILVGYLFYLNQVIVTRFEARRWNLPSRLYSDTYSLYKNQNITASELISRLDHLGYRLSSTKPTEPGLYYKEGSHFEIFLHNFDYPYENFEGFLLGLDLENNTITRLSDLQKNTPIDLTELEPELIASIYDDNREDRTFVALSQIPRVLTQAVVLIEDERFYSHHGVDPVGILRALVKNIISGKIVQGGSTLTQQMVKNFFLTQERSLIRKINEALMALIIDVRYSKDEIIEVYLNEIYFGQQGPTSITGVQEASRYYFSKTVSQLSPDQAALLAAIIKAPGIYSPFVNKEKAKQRRDLILNRLHDNKFLDDSSWKKALNKDLPKKSDTTKRTTAPYFIDFVKQQLKEHFPQNVLNSEGLRIFTTLDMHWQRLAENSLKENLNQLEKTRALLKNNKEKNQELEGALIALDPKTGFIKAYVGGRDFSTNQFDIISQAKRQPGSTFKPFVYLTALDPALKKNPLTAASLINDTPITLDTGAGAWSPDNYDKKFHGTVTVREALEKSYNVATVWLAKEVGLDNIIETAKKAGITAPLQPYYSLVLGAIEVTPLELVQAYTIFPNNGEQTKPFGIRRVMTPEGDVLEKKSFEMNQVFSHDVIYIMNKILQGVFDKGTAAAARTRGFTAPAAGKTGTTSDYKDSWFVGYTPDVLALSWVGYKDNQTTGLSGASGALPVWTDFMKKALLGKPQKEFQPSENIIILPIDKKTGLVYHWMCGGEKYDEFFIEGTEPREYCYAN